MEYFRDPKNQIYADLAFRLGRIITQYEKAIFDEEKFEATLYIAVLQNLMTNSNEYVREMTRSARKNSIFNKEINNHMWGIDENCWVKNTFNEKPTLQNFITRIRNSVSHPTNIDIDSQFPSTGFTTQKNNSGLVNKYIFINSPDTNNNRQKILSKEQVLNTIFKRNSNIQIKHLEFPSDITYTEIPNNPGKYQLTRKDEPFIRISRIELSIKQLGDFVKGLANYLAQPVQNDWDGVIIKDLIAV